jgi:hypothetical protein
MKTQKLVFLTTESSIIFLFKKMCRVSARKLSIYNTGWGSHMTEPKFIIILSTNQNRHIKKKGATRPLEEWCICETVIERRCHKLQQLERDYASIHSQQHLVKKYLRMH